MRLNGTGGHPAVKLARTALCTAIVFVATFFIKIPIPLGYANLGNGMILLISVFFGPGVGAAAGGVGSALADLVSYPEWTIPTLIIKALMGALCGAIADRHVKRLRTLAAVIAATAEMIFGYFVGGSVLYGSVYTGALQIPGLSIEGLVGIAVFFIAGLALERAGVMDRINRS